MYINLVFCNFVFIKLVPKVSLLISLGFRHRVMPAVRNDGFSPFPTCVPFIFFFLSYPIGCNSQYYGIEVAMRVDSLTLIRFGENFPVSTSPCDSTCGLSCFFLAQGKILFCFHHKNCYICVKWVFCIFWCNPCCLVFSFLLW